jgi:hypothetical protein
MALDFYSVDDVTQSNKLFSLANRDVDLLDDLFYEYSKLTGNIFDVYGKNRIYEDHKRLLISMLTKRLEENSKQQTATLLPFLNVLKTAKGVLLAIGD